MCFHTFSMVDCEAIKGILFGGPGVFAAYKVASISVLLVHKALSSVEHSVVSELSTFGQAFMI